MRYLNVLLFCLITTFCSAQNNFLNGKIIDSATNLDVTNGTVTLIKAKDSSLFHFTRIKKDGTFLLKKPEAGKYILFISHPKFADLIDSIDIEANKNDLGNIYFTSKKKVLEQVIVRAKVSPVKIKGDTVIYTADSFKVKDGATVEDLLKKLPGIQVDRNGEIKAMGETVKKVLVDGEEFFGSDPGVAIKNLQANVVDKVEVFDKKSDQATFTGIDDGVKDKTINLKLKDNKKNGYFGKVETAGGTPENYSNQGMINAFKAKRKMAAFGIMSNTGSTGLGWEDSQNYGGSNNMEMGMSDDGGMWMSYQGDEFDNYWGGSNGIPKNWNGGLHYSNKFNDGKQSINFGYKYNKVNALAENATFSKTFLPDSSWNDNSGRNAFSSKIRNQINGSVETKLDSFNVLKFNFNASDLNNTTSSKTFSESYSDVNPINASKRTNTNNTKSKNITGSAIWMHKFKKMGRTLSINATNTNNKSDADGFLLSYNTFYKNGTLLKKDTVDQEKINTRNSNNFSTKISYTEPLTKKLTAEIGYTYSNNTNDNNNQSLNKDAGGKYAIVAQQFTNHYTFNTNVHTPGLSFIYKAKKLTAQIGSKIGINDFNQKNLSNNTTQQYHFTNFFPTANINFKLKGNKNLRFGYNGNGQAPTLNQLQPIQDNTNPFYIVTGNPDLKQSFSHSFNGSFNMWNVLKNTNMWSYFNFNKNQNAYTNFSSIDSLGRTISKTVNVNGNYYLNGNVNYGFKIKKLGLRVGFGPNINLNNSNNFINGLKNNSKSITYGMGINLNKSSENEKWEVGVSSRFNQNKNKASINQTSTTDFWSIDGDIYMNCKLFKTIEMETNANYESRQKDPRYPRNNNLFLWNASIQKDLVKNVFKLRFSVNDILNKNRGFDRSFSSYNYTESFFTTLKRYWLVTLTYKFNSQKTKPTTNAK